MRSTLRWRHRRDRQGEPDNELDELLGGDTAAHRVVDLIRHLLTNEVDFQLPKGEAATQRGRATFARKRRRP
jgi:hypothetical protein